MTDSFQSYAPASGKRRPRIAYDLDDPRVQVLEQLRQKFGYRHMNDAYLTALALGARLILQNEDPYAVVQRFADLRPGKRNKSIKAKAEASAASVPNADALKASVSTESASTQDGPQVVTPSLRGFAGRSNVAPARGPAPRPTLTPAAELPVEASPAPQATHPSRPASSLAAHHFGLYGGNDLDES